ncbi:hypothetical protein BKA58DRAFT_373930 [Alternaria rosae]|uniref:uncharacterized protein n=1 Tax=Alternaria rosae TaxID=1187941 RepID=UPI001E8CB690|nr:uncharacterized protein BKA58DRAFT_373930 [Alternaria rosae]KAH6882790.1 hypothetical protein BKA58DRAFT_373930 [Alternaria rosae]
MTRVYHPRAQQAPQRGTTLDQSRAAIRKKKPYKIVLEAVTQEKKKLHSILTYASNAPAGFGFIPAGHPEFTEWCKEQCRQRNLDVHIVSAKPKNKTHSDPEKLSHHVHRVGHHFPIHIIELACSKFGYLYDERRGLRKDKEGDRTNWIAQEFEDYSSRQVQRGHPATEKETKGYIHGAVREMFPKIPEADLQAIVSHAFEEGTNRVGNAKELSLARRVQLAVVAHIRHTYTDYDKLLKTDGWSEARGQVEKVSLAKLKEWRDEDGKQSNELEETFREVIVLDDDDEASSDEGSMATPDEREQSMEIVSSRATARDLQPELHANYPSGDVHNMRPSSRRTIVLPRYAPPPPPPVLSGTSHFQSHLQQPFQPARTRTNDPRARPAEAGQSIRNAQPIVREINGQLYQLQPIKEDRGASRLQYNDPPLRAAPRRVQEGYVQPPSPRHSAFDRPLARPRRPSDQDVVLPSVEPETVDLTSPQHIATSQQPAWNHNANQNRPYNELQSPKRKALPSFADDRQSQAEQHAKRLRPVYREEARPRTYGDNQAGYHMSQRMAPDYGPRAPPPREQVIDLTTSPYKPPSSGGRGYDVSARPLAPADPRGYAYASGPSHRMHVHEVRGAQYDVHPVDPSRAYVPDNRMYERRLQPNHDYIPLREDEQPRRLEDESVRYLRSGVRYGG